MTQVLSYADKNYQQSKAVYDVMQQCLEDIKYGRSSSVHNADAMHGGVAWNTPVDQVKGIVMRFLGENHIQLTYTHWEVGTVEQMAQMDLDKDGEKFLKEVEKQLKKRFKSYTKKSLTLKKVKLDHKAEKGSNVQSDTSWMIGSSRFGYGSRPLGRYLIKDACFYEFKTTL